ncbi:hypothetical protein GCM10009853_045100 [Glycomyces scopariae]
MVTGGDAGSSAGPGSAAGVSLMQLLSQYSGRSHRVYFATTEPAAPEPSL